jgi:hypothetical protein
MNLNGLRKPLKQKSCTKMVNMRVLEKAFNNNYGRSYISEKGFDCGKETV